ncbi:DUF2813 domain-containing protein [Glaesserella sp.]|uniref:DUF2813 domain-containing protein n=1 Tax=Glaesserella sp. TaxID=2094731 RepID=UPI0035A1BD3B
MYLKSVDIQGFRGINSLSLRLRPNMVFIGENAWGKSSLLEALSEIFNLKNELYQFVDSDFHIHYGDQLQKCHQLSLRFTFCESIENERNLEHFAALKPFFMQDENQKYQLHIEVLGEHCGDKINTSYRLVDEQLQALPVPNAELLIQQIIHYHPVYRFRDARLNKAIYNVQLADEYAGVDEEFKSELAALAQLIQYYFLTAHSRKQVKAQGQDNGYHWEKLKALCLRLQKSPELAETVREFISQFFVLEGKPTHIQMPIVLFEDMGAQLHPRMVSIFWELVSQLQIQKITTTNSMELLSQMPLRDICRFVRYRDHTQAYSLDRHSLGKEDLRKLSFHIHHNRGLALFSKTWILVEGETEVWILEELAKLLHLNLDMEGIRIVEFAQCGLRPLIKYAKAMGIEWYVLTDGDDAGRRYAETVNSFEEQVERRLTILPSSDIEHFFYKSGFQSVFIKLARWQQVGKHQPIAKIIKRAIHQTSKPDLAIALAQEIERQGEQSIPRLFRKMFARVMTLTRKGE